MGTNQRREFLKKPLAGISAASLFPECSLNDKYEAYRTGKE
jgi:hypothetical protein